MEGTTSTRATPEPSHPLVCRDDGQACPFAQQWVTIAKQERIELEWRGNYWQAQHARVKSQLEEAKQEIILRDAKIKDLQNRLFGKTSEKDTAAKSEKGNNPNPPSKRNRGQQPGSRGHGRTPRPDLPVLPQDWQVIYGYRPVLLETFVERPRFEGTCYKAANWIYLGQTQGRGKLGPAGKQSVPIKDLWVYPLDRRFRQVLTR